MDSNQKMLDYMNSGVYKHRCLVLQKMDLSAIYLELVRLCRRNWHTAGEAGGLMNTTLLAPTYNLPYLQAAHLKLLNAGREHHAMLLFATQWYLEWAMAQKELDQTKGLRGPRNLEHGKPKRLAELIACAERWIELGLRHQGAEERDFYEHTFGSGPVKSTEPSIADRAAELRTLTIGSIWRILRESVIARKARDRDTQLDHIWAIVMQLYHQLDFGDVSALGVYLTKVDLSRHALLLAALRQFASWALVQHRGGAPDPNQGRHADLEKLLAVAEWWSRQKPNGDGYGAYEYTYYQSLFPNTATDWFRTWYDLTRPATQKPTAQPNLAARFPASSKGGVATTIPIGWRVADSVSLYSWRDALAVYDWTKIEPLVVSNATKEAICPYRPLFGVFKQAPYTWVRSRPDIERFDFGTKPPRSPSEDVGQMLRNYQQSVALHWLQEFDEIYTTQSGAAPAKVTTDSILDCLREAAKTEHKNMEVNVKLKTRDRELAAEHLNRAGELLQEINSVRTLRGMAPKDVTNTVESQVQVLWLDSMKKLPITGMDAASIVGYLSALLDLEYAKLERVQYALHQKADALGEHQ